MPGAHKIGAAISGPRNMGRNFMDTTLFLTNLDFPDSFGQDGSACGCCHGVLGVNARIVGIADGSGCAEDPNGLPHDELLRLFRAGSLPAVIFKFVKIKERGGACVAWGCGVGVSCLLRGWGWGAECTKIENRTMVCDCDCSAMPPDNLKEEGRGTRNGYEASKGSKGISGL